MIEPEFEPPTGDEDGDLWFHSPLDVWDHIDMAMVRPRPFFELPAGPGHRVQLGAGRKLIQGWTNLDFPDWDANDVESDRWRIPFADATVSQIVSYHTLDHLEPWAVLRTLQEVQRVLLTGGTFNQIVPHYMGQLANECLMHKSRWAIDTFRNIFSERQYKHTADGQIDEWELEVGANFIFGYTERNLVLVTQLVRK
jgi:hypothetical protein